MKPADRSRLLAALRGHVASIAADLRQKMRDPAFEGGAARARARKLHEDEHVAEDFDVWTDLLSRRAAVLWVLKTVYVRVLEDRGLLSPGRLLDVESQHLFEKLAPNLGETAFLRWIFRDLASEDGGLPELFAPQPAEIVAPADELSRALLAFWRHRDADTGEGYRFADERFEGELMGDLYQELDPVVKDRFALCQTPDFVRAFILDRTLTPAIETFGVGTVRLLDPACGSGHFLIDGLRRLVAATVAARGGGEGAPTREEVVGCLERVVGIDLNDYACGLARARLIMTAAELLGVKTLAEAAAFHPHVYWADGLEQVERDEVAKPVQGELFGGPAVEKVRATLTRSDVRAKLRGVFGSLFHAVVANPPYITEKDAARKEYHRERIDKGQRYVSASGKYSLGSPFAERCFQLAAPNGYVGLITSNNFMKRDFGRTLVERVLCQVDLSLVVDTSQAYIPFHDTPTVMVLARNRRPTGDTVRVVMGKRGEVGIPTDASKGLVWLSISKGWAASGFEDDYVSVADLPRGSLAAHPWSLGGGGAAELKAVLEKVREARLSELTQSIGITCFTLEDDVFISNHPDLARRGVDPRFRVAMVEGDVLRDWALGLTPVAIRPYDEAWKVLQRPASIPVERALWRYRTTLSNNKMFGGRTKVEDGLRWYEFGRLTRAKLEYPLAIAFASVATHNHFVLDRGEKLFKQSAAVIKLPAGTSEAAHFPILGVLNSSTGCFWMKQVFYPKGSATKDLDRGGLVPENNRFDFASTGMESFPMPPGIDASPLPVIARRLDELARERVLAAPAAILETTDLRAGAHVLRTALEEAAARDQAIFERMIFWQEEADWVVYELFGLVPRGEARWLTEARVPLGHRSFEWAEADDPPAGLPPHVQAEYLARRRLTERHPALRLLENVVQKRPWRGVQGVFGRYDRTAAEKGRTAMRLWIANRVEAVSQGRLGAFTLDQLVSVLQDDRCMLTVCEVLTERPDFSLRSLVLDALTGDSVPSHRFHVYKAPGLVKREAWERTWADQRREDAGEKLTPDVPPAYGTPDFLKTEYWQLRGKLDVPKERFIAFTEVPNRLPADTLYGWAGWTPLQRLRALLAIDEDLEDAGTPLADRIGVLDSAWRLLPDVARDDAKAAASLRAELSALVGPEGPSQAMVEDWGRRFPAKVPRASKANEAVDPTDHEETAAKGEALPAIQPKLPPAEDATFFIWALLHASDGTATRTDLARAFALRARPALLKKLAPASLKSEVVHWRSVVGARAPKSGLLASTLAGLAERNGVLLRTNDDGRSTVSVSQHTLPQEEIDAWFNFEADLALRVLRAQPEEGLRGIDASLSAADRKLVEVAA